MKPIDQLMKYTMAAKAILANVDRLESLVNMLGTKPGAITAVHTVIEAIKQSTQIPPDVLPTLSINIYVMLVDAARTISGEKPDPEIMRKVIAELVPAVTKAAQQPQQPPQQAPQGGLIAAAQGA